MAQTDESGPERLIGNLIERPDIHNVDITLLDRVSNMDINVLNDKSEVYYFDLYKPPSLSTLTTKREIQMSPTKEAQLPLPSSSNSKSREKLEISNSSKLVEPSINASNTKDLKEKNALYEEKLVEMAQQLDKSMK